MNIKEHIEAGHYPKDEKGRALVPMKGGGIATILSTDIGHCAIWGARNRCAVTEWRDDGQNWGPHSNCRTNELTQTDLLPPPPRKVVVVAWGIRAASGTILEIRTGKPDSLAVSERNLISGTFEYEEPWS